MNAYYQLINTQTADDGSVTTFYKSTDHAQGAWNTHEQHMAPASGVMAREMENFQPRDDMRIGRISFDIFGLIPAGEFSITTRVIRPGRTIELIESEMQAQGKTCIVARAWRMATQNSSAVAALEDPAVHHPDTLPAWQGISHWPGGYIKSLEAKIAENHRDGKGIVWLNNSLEMVENFTTSDFVHLIGMVDTANGTAPRQGSNITWAFPNLDLQIHLHRYPSGQWLGLETVQQYGEDGIGLTSAILHDEQGPFGRSEQILTLRKLG
ncbi:thioesterase family protein [Marinospirillum insulare]|uniref:Thioesterase n=1 Tax=Marinospirillum insulare TaxID=217169 RepID=A0ABQ6A116_9GAMM|nr:thioesterase family protein [Marinospirillum insulare]GLR63824.1 thioesterase [Marinospirillum insulare]